MSDSDVPELVNSSSEEEDEDKACWCSVKAGDSLRQYIERNDSDKHRHLMKIYVLSPLMLGARHQPEIWLQYLHDCKLLPSVNVEKTFLASVLIEDQFLHVADLLDECISLVQFQMIERKVQLADLIQLFESLDTSVFPRSDHRHRAVSLSELLHKSKVFKFLHSWQKLIGDKQAKMKIHPDITLDSRQLVVCLLFAARQYIAYAMEMEDTDNDLYKEFQNTCAKSDDEVKPMKEKGNACFKDKQYKGAIKAYSQAIRKHRYSAILYGNRAQSFSYSNMYNEALSDSLRSITLDPLWHKGYYRCAQALFDLNRVEQALKITALGINRCPYDRNLREQQIKFTRALNENPLKPHPKLNEYRNNKRQEKKDEDDEPPDLLTSSSDSSDDDHSSESDPEKPDPVYEKFMEKQKEREKEKEAKKEERKRIEESRRKEEQERQRKADEEFRRREARRKEEEKRKEEERKRKAAENAARQKEEEKRKKILLERQEKDNRHTQLVSWMADGSNALLDDRAANAYHLYDKVLDFISKHREEYFERNKEIDYVVIKYSIGDACVKMSTSKEIQQGMTWFREILDKHPSIKFPLAFLGLGRAFRAQNRFAEALVPLGKGLKVVRNLGNYSVNTWPGTNKAIEESRPVKLTVALRELMVTCTNPPPPEAVCRYHHCQAHYSVRIYINDPDLKGFVRIRCFAKCKIEYHLDCWRRFKKERIATQDKDYLNITCLTSDCEERLSEIIIYDHNGVATKTLESPKREIAPNNKRAIPVKMKSTSEAKIARKEERKRRRKELKLMSKTTAESDSEDGENALNIIDCIENAASADGLNGGDSGEPTPLPAQLSPVMVLRKDNDDFMDMPVRAKKSKKKEKVAKTTMSLDEFVERDYEVVEDENGVLHRKPIVKAKYPVPSASSPYAVPSNIQQEVAAFESTLNSSDLRSLSMDKSKSEITANLMSFFAGLLRAHGPTMQDDVVIQRELEEFPQEARDLINKAGGVGKFLIQSLEFAMIDNVVCLMTDAVKARALSEGLKTPFHDRYVQSVKEKPETPSLTSQIFDTSLGGFPNSLNVIKSNGNATGSPIETESQGAMTDLFADINFSAMQENRTLLDQLDLIDDDGIDGGGFSSNILPTPPQVSRCVSSSVDNRSDATSGIDEGMSQKSGAAPTKSLDDIDDEISDVTSSDGRLSESRSNSSLPMKDILKKKLMSSAVVERVSIDSVDKKVTPKSLRPIPSNSDIARLDDFDTCSRGSIDALDDIESSSSNIARNQNHIQALKNFTNTLSASCEHDIPPCSDSPPVLPPGLQFKPKHSSPASSVHSWPNPRCENSQSLSEISHSHSEPRPVTENHGPLKSSRLQNWLNKPITTENTEAVTSPEVDKIAGGILTNTEMWSKKTVDLSCLDGMGGLIADDDDDMDAMKPDMTVETRNADHDPSPVRSEPSPIRPPSRSHTPDARSIHSISPAPPGFSSAVVGLPKPSVAADEPIGYPRGGNVYGAIGSRTDSPLHGSVSSRNSSKPGTPAHTPADTPRPSIDPLPTFPSAHDTDTFPSVLAPDLSAGALPINVSKIEADTLFPTSNASVLFNPASSLFPPPKSNFWGSGGDNVEEDAPMESLNGIDYDEVVNKHNEEIDNAFVKEMSIDAYNRLKDTSTFKDNPNLLHQIEQDVRQDVEKSKVAPITAFTNNHRSNSTISNTTTNINRKTRNSAVQYDVTMTSSDKACNTELYNPNKEQLQLSHLQLEQTTSRLQELMDRFTKLKNSSTVEKRGLQSQLDATEQEAKELRLRCARAVEERDTERGRWTQERRGLSEDVRALRQQYRAAKSVESNVEAELQQQRGEVQQLSKQLLADRETLASERKKHEDDLNVMRVHAGTNLARAQNSEVKFLKLQMSVGNQILESALKECEMRCVQFTQFFQSMIETNQSVPAHLQTADEQWRSNVKVIREMKDTYMREHEEQIDAVKTGTPLERLPELGLPKPPPPPQVAMPMQGRAMMPGPIMPPMINPFMNTGPPPFFVQNGASSSQQDRQTNASSNGPSYPPGLVRNQPQHKGKTSFEKIIAQLTKVFPGATREDFMKHIHELRQARGGKLSGMTMAQIVQQVAERILQTQQLQQHKPVMAGRLSNSKFAAAASVGAGEEIFEEEEDPCMICFDELLPINTTRLQCGHRYHSDCIKKWFQEQSTCPMCRNHALLPDEYPSLG